MKQIVEDTRGVIALIAIILVVANTLLYGMSVALLNSDELVAAQGWLARSKAQQATSSCLENSLARLRNDDTVTGNVNIATSNVNCIATISGGSNVRAILLSATSTDAYSREFVHRANVNVNINTNPFTIEQYKDIID